MNISLAFSHTGSSIYYVTNFGAISEHPPPKMHFCILGPFLSTLPPLSPSAIRPQTVRPLPGDVTTKPPTPRSNFANSHVGM